MTRRDKNKERSLQEIRKDLQEALKSLKALTEKTEQMVQQLESYEKGRTAGMSRPRTAAVKSVERAAGKRSAKATAIDTVLAAVSRRKKGVGIAEIRERTSLSDNHIRVILYRLKERGQVKSAGRGLYIKA